MNKSVWELIGAFRPGVVIAEIGVELLERVAQAAREEMRERAALETRNWMNTSGIEERIRSLSTESGK